MDDTTTVSVRIGTFEPSGIPIEMTKHLGEYGTVAFQAITLNLLLAQMFDLEAAGTVYVHHQAGSNIRIDRTLKGFTAYVGT
jgi:hypothetical protein